MQLKVNKTECPFCDKVFYEWDESLLEECPHCERKIGNMMTANVIGSQIVEVELDLITGVVKIAGTDVEVDR